MMIHPVIVRNDITASAAPRVCVYFLASIADFEPQVAAHPHLDYVDII
jgi:hypothetical protein